MKKCGKCKQVGHNIRTCNIFTPTLIQSENQNTNIDSCPALDTTKIIENTPITHIQVPTALTASNASTVEVPVNTQDMDNYNMDNCNMDNYNNICDREYDIDIPECGICLEPLQSDYVNATPCEHMYHQICLWSWLMIKPECPTCRMIVGVNELITIDYNLIKGQLSL
jgi:hypothetical protein